jgi:hypothetical protein
MNGFYIMCLCSDAEYDIRSSVILLLPLFITHNVDSSTVDLEQSNAEYDTTHVVDSSTVELEQSNAEYISYSALDCSRSTVLLSTLCVINKGNNKITELRISYSALDCSSSTWRILITSLSYSYKYYYHSKL